MIGRFESKVAFRLSGISTSLNKINLFSQVSRDSPSEVNRLRRERDELQSLVEKFEKHLTEVYYSNEVGLVLVPLGKNCDIVSRNCLCNALMLLMFSTDSGKC